MNPYTDSDIKPEMFNGGMLVNWFLFRFLQWENKQYTVLAQINENCVILGVTVKKKLL